MENPIALSGGELYNAVPSAGRDILHRWMDGWMARYFINRTHWMHSHLALELTM